MATSSRQTNIFGVNDWKTIYKNYSQADFQSYDFETIRKTFVDYLRTYYPETFNDYIESSEYVALLDVIAYMGQALAFRGDLNTRENFIDTAERRDSVIKLANLVGYTPKRNIAGQGYLKVSSISTTEQIRDINNLNLSNLTILWNDPANPNWQQQFNTIINAALIDSQKFGSPGNTKTVLGVKTDEYSIALPAGASPTVPFTATVDNIPMSFEGVSVTTVDSEDVREVSPGIATTFNLLYRNDKLGFGSPNTGFFMYFKQGTLQTFDFLLEEQISNQSVAINIEGINNTDTWLYQTNSTTGEFIEWIKVDSVYASSNLQRLTSNKKLFSVNSRSNDQVSYIFGDGVFSEIPVGSFTSYVRSSNGLSYVIDPSEFQNLIVNLNYVSRRGRVETLTMALTLELPVSTAQARESLADIKLRAPQRYYTQNRMVNGEDYNNFPFTLYSSIIKSKAINRTSIGVSRNYDLLDPSGKYSSTNDFADDGALYQELNDGFTFFVANTTNDIINFLSEYLPNVLGDNRSYQYYTQFYSRKLINDASGDGTITWNQSTNDGGQSTGYFYNTSNIPVNIGIYGSNNLRYVTVGSMISFTAPPGYYFDPVDNRLIAGLPTSSDVTSIWTTVSEVIGDGSNSGEGNLSNDSGPVILNNTIPDGAILTVVIPSFSNTLSNALVQECTTKIRLNQNFSLVYNNSLLINQERWSTSSYSDLQYFVKFQSVGIGRYLVSWRKLTYYFGSVSDVRFSFDRDKIIYDPASGKLMQDYISVLKSNSQPSSNSPLPKDFRLSVVGQLLESDGYVDDYSVEVSNGYITDVGTFKDPDFFLNLVGYVNNTRNTKYFTFFRKLTDANLLTRFEIVPTNDIVYGYGTQADIALVKYEYRVGQVFYAVLENNFYRSVNDATSANIVNLELLNNYVARTGRQGFYFQYKHISSETTRIDPGTTNIIDLYILTSAYYTQYTNWLRDATGTVAEPAKPTINELTQTYYKVNEYKMLSDSLVVNSAKFKPLFGDKAPPELQATIKVIKSSTTTASDNEIRSAVLTEINNYFSIDNWDFGDTFYFSELAAYLHNQIGDLISSAVLVPNDPQLSFGDLYEIHSTPYEIFASAAQGSDIVVIAALTPAELQPNS
jgi:hypothetical protein